MPTKKELQKQINSIKETIKSDYISYIFLKNRVGFIEECFCCKAVNNMETIKKGDTLNPNLYSIVFLKDGVPVSPQIDMTGFYEYKTKTLGVSLDTSDRLHIAKMNGITDFTHYVLPHSLKLNPDSLEGMDVKTLKWCQFNPKTFEIIPSELKDCNLNINEARLEFQEWILNNKDKDWELFFEDKEVDKSLQLSLYASPLCFTSRVWDCLYYEAYIAKNPFNHEWMKKNGYYPD
jgi:hypothetical protein